MSPALILPIEPARFVMQIKELPVIDVRSPGEYCQGHVPGAFNIPVFDDAERALVGTLYVQSGREEAILKGLDLALPKTGRYIKHLLTMASGKDDIMVHCWRGGLRSTLMAEVFSKAGYNVSLLAGGYKAYRRFNREAFGRAIKMVVVGGFTGSGKTELLNAIAARGEQVVDLEALACHKGSVFGALGQPPQPTNEQFENNLADRWSALDVSRIVWVEDESRMIGRVTLPDPIVEHISSGMLIRVEPGIDVRINRLVKEYSGFDKQNLADAIYRIAERLGGSTVKTAITALENGQFQEVAAIVLNYYDKAYLHSMERRKGKIVHSLPVSGTEIDKDAKRIIDFVYKLL